LRVGRNESRGITRSVCYLSANIIFINSDCFSRINSIASAATICSARAGFIILATSGKNFRKKKEERNCDDERK
jgi:hypothetical protein